MKHWKAEKHEQGIGKENKYTARIKIMLTRNMTDVVGTDCA